jgi:hypothetical protein
MNILELYKSCQNLSNKDSKGNGFTIEMLNNELPIVSLEKFQSYWKLAQNIAASEKKDLAEVIFDLQNLSSFVAIENANDSKPEFIDYPADFRYSLSMVADNKPVDIRPYTEIGRFRRGFCSGNPDEKPLAFEGDGKFEMIPNDLKNIRLTYLRAPATPYYDFCLSADDLEIFMPEGSYVKYSLNMLEIFILYDSDGVLIESNVFREDFDILVRYNSKTIELDWPDVVHPQIANSVLERLGVNLRSPEIVQWTQAQEK